MSKEDINALPKRTCELADFKFDLPKDLIAQSPLKVRDKSRMLVLNRQSGGMEDKSFSDILDYISPGDAIVLNNTKVFAARLNAKKTTGGKVEVLLAERSEDTPEIWKALTKPGLKVGQVILFEGRSIEAESLGISEDGYALIRFNNDDIQSLIHQYGQMPLPPYIKRLSDEADKDSYQCVFAQEEGSIAAPTAGLHFTEVILNALKTKGVHVVFVTLHVGYGTFQPVKDLKTHQMKAERFVLSEESVQILNKTKEAGHKIWAVGSTSTRVLETCVMKKKIVSGEGRTDLFITPPFEFEVVDHLITNFHLPESTLLMLVSAFASNKLIKKAYEHGVKEKYRFFSYGDCMLIL